MKFFVDTGNIADIKRLHALGIVDGVTTNPSLMAKEKQDPKAILKEICDIVQGPVSGEVVATDVEGMLREGRELREISEHIVVKVPFSAAQALIAAKVGAYFVSPFVGRLDDIGHDGMDLIEDIVEIYDNYEFTTQVLVASTRGPMHIIQAAKLGADICTCPPAVIEALFKHPLTDIGLERFLKDWEKAQQK
jgi:transaldolase